MNKIVGGPFLDRVLSLYQHKIGCVNGSGSLMVKPWFNSGRQPYKSLVASGRENEKKENSDLNKGMHDFNFSRLYLRNGGR